MTLLTKLRRLPIDLCNKVHAVRAKVYAATLYGCEAADPRDAQMEKLAAAVIDLQHSANDNHDRDWWFFYS